MDAIKGLFQQGSSDGAMPVPSEDADFADFAGAPVPEPASISPIPPAGTSAARALPTGSYGGARPYTAWYRVWERTTINDFYQELFILPFVLLVVVIHIWGTRANRRKARGWMRAHLPALHQEFSMVGFGGKGPSITDVQGEGLARAMANQQVDANLDELMRQKKSDEFATYATGRQNVAFVDIKLTLLKRYNPLLRFGEAALGFFFESMPPPQEKMEATLYPFDGREQLLLVPSGAEAQEKGREIKKVAGNSTYDSFVFAVVHKDLMKRMRDERYDLSLTSTKDNAKLPAWATVMSESAEITETLLTPELVKAIEAAGDDFESLIVTDMPLDQPKKLDELVPRKRVSLALRLPSSYENTLPIFTYFLRFPDTLVSNARFRPEALRRVKQTREEETKKIRKVDAEEKAEDRKLAADKKKKEERDALLSRMSADDQKKYLEKERERDARKKQKKQTVKA